MPRALRRLPLHPARGLVGSQLSPQDALRYAGEANRVDRDRIASAGRSAVTSVHRCDRRPEFREAAEGLVRAAYPAWFRESFFGLASDRSGT
jgi:hypothetical protein